MFKPKIYTESYNNYIGIFYFNISSISILQFVFEILKYNNILPTFECYNTRTVINTNKRIYQIVYVCYIMYACI